MRTPDHAHTDDAEEKKAQEGGGIDGWAWAHPPSSRRRASRRWVCDVGCPRMDLIIIYYIGTTLYIMVFHMPICAHARRTHARTHAHARPRDGAFDGHSTRAMDTKNIKQKTKKRAFWRCTRGDEGPWSTVHGQASRQRPWRPWRTAAAPVVDAVVVVVVVVRTTRARDVNQRHDASGR